MDEDDVRRASARFYEATNGILGGDAAPMLAVWSRGDDVTYCDTSGRVQRGWAALETYWRQAAERNAGAEAKLSATATEQTVCTATDLAYTVMVEEVRRAGGALVLTARATNVYRREGGEWRMLHRHADAPPRTSPENGGE